MRLSDEELAVFMAAERKMIERGDESFLYKGKNYSFTEAEHIISWSAMSLLKRLQKLPEKDAWVLMIEDEQGLERWSFPTKEAAEKAQIELMATTYQHSPEAKPVIFEIAPFDWSIIKKLGQVLGIALLCSLLAIALWGMVSGRWMAG